MLTYIFTPKVMLDSLRFRGSDNTLLKREESELGGGREWAIEREKGRKNGRREMKLWMRRLPVVVLSPLLVYLMLLLTPSCSITIIC